MATLQPNYEHNLQVLEKLTPGDLIAFPRRLYSHWGVYMGNEMVIHLYGLQKECLRRGSQLEHLFVTSGSQFTKAEVRVDGFWDVVKGCKAKRNNDKERVWKPFPPVEILDRAKLRLGGAKYSLRTSNCEHFAKWCRYGISQSDQVDNAFKAVKSVADAVSDGFVVGTQAIASTAASLSLSISSAAASLSFSISNF